MNKIKLFFKNLPQKIFGWSLIIGHKTFHFGLDKWWLFWDGHRPDKDPTGKTGWGIVFAFRFGAILRPVPKLWKWQRSNRFPGIAPAFPNPWTSGQHWFNIIVPWWGNFILFLCLCFLAYYQSFLWYILLPNYCFFSIAYKGKGAYMGVKDLYLYNRDYLNAWMPIKYFVKFARALTWSLSLRWSRNQ